MMHAYEHACRTTQGARHCQEDSAAFLIVAEEGGVEPPALRALLAVLADGMGGHAGGDVASRLLCESFIAAFGAEADERPAAERLLLSLEAANTALAERVSQEPMLSGMGSTVIGALFGAEGIEWISVGDSPLFLWRNGEIAQLNEDHSLAPELDKLAAAGHMTRQEAMSDPRRHMLRSAVTGEDISMIDRPGVITELFPGDYVVLASDGIQSLENEEIAAIVSAYAADGPEAVAEALIRGVENLRVPHQDNATVVVVRPVAGWAPGRRWRQPR